MLPLIVQTVLAILGVLCFGYAVKRAVRQKKIDCLLFLLGGLVLVFAEYFSWIDGYWLSVIKFMRLGASELYSLSYTEKGNSNRSKKLRSIPVTLPK